MWTFHGGELIKNVHFWTTPKILIGSSRVRPWNIYYSHSIIQYSDVCVILLNRHGTTLRQMLWLSPLYRTGMLSSQAQYSKLISNRNWAQIQTYLRPKTRSPSCSFPHPAHPFFLSPTLVILRKAVALTGELEHISSLIWRCL